MNDGIRNCLLVANTLLTVAMGLAWTYYSAKLRKAWRDDVVMGADLIAKFRNLAIQFLAERDEAKLKLQEYQTRFGALPEDAKIPLP